MLLDILGKTITAITVAEDKESIDIITDDGSAYRMYHLQDCCESVTVEDVIGDLDDLIGSPLTMAEESTSTDDPEDKNYNAESSTWTFYKFATVKGYVTIRWYGWSNGYYSEGVSFVKL